MNKITSILSIALYIGLAGCSNSSSTDRFEKIAQEENKKYPLKLATDITIDSTAFCKEQHTVYYYYTISGQLDDSAHIAKNSPTIMQSLKDAAENSPEMEIYRKAGCAACYCYYSASTRKKLAEFKFNL